MPKTTSIRVIVAMALFCALMGCGAATGPNPAALEATVTAKVLATQTAIAAQSAKAPTPLPALGGISGVVSWATQGVGNRVVVGITVRVWSRQANQVAIGITDATGRYTIPDMVAGIYTVSAYQPAATSGTQIVQKCWVFPRIEVAPSQATQVNMDFDNSVSDSFSNHPQCK